MIIRTSLTAIAFNGAIYAALAAVTPIIRPILIRLLVGGRRRNNRRDDPVHRKGDDGVLTNWIGNPKPFA